LADATMLSNPSSFTTTSRRVRTFGGELLAQLGEFGADLAEC